MDKEDREELQEILRLVVKPIDDLLQEHHRTLFGNGTEGNQGLRVDVDRIKQNEQRADKHFWILYPATITFALKAAWDFFRKGN